MLQEVLTSTRGDLSVNWPFSQNNAKRVEHCKDCIYWAHCKNYDCPGTTYGTTKGSFKPTCFSDFHSTK